MDTPMTRRDDLHRKCSNLLRAYTRSPENMAMLWLGKYCGLRLIMKSMPEHVLDETVESHNAHIQLAMVTDALRTPSMGIRRVSNGIIGALFGYESHSVNRYI